jgi:hypothetical protein
LWDTVLQFQFDEVTCVQLRALQHAAVAATLRDAHLLWKAFDTGQSHLQVTAITIIAAKLLLLLLLLLLSLPAQHSTISLS